MLDGLGEQRLWQAVVNEALMVLSQQKIVEEDDIVYFFHDDGGLERHCMAAGFNVEKVRDAARRIMAGELKLDIKKLKRIQHRTSI